MEETIKDMKEYFKERGLDKSIVEDVAYTCERLGKYIMNWDTFNNIFVVVYSDYSIDVYDLY